MEVRLIMNDYLFQGQQVEINELNLIRDATKADLKLQIISKCNIVNILFRNISDLKNDNFSVPFQICGFEILDNRENGWESSRRYIVQDFEDGKIQFCCENFMII